MMIGLVFTHVPLDPVGSCGPGAGNRFEATWMFSNQNGAHGGYLGVFTVAVMTFLWLTYIYMAVIIIV